MLLSTPEYFYFLVLVFFVYWLVRRVRMAGVAVICVANYFFYAKWGLVYLALVPLASTCDFLIGRALGRTERPGMRRLLVSTSLAINIGLIVTCKYVPVVVGTWAGWTHQTAASGWVLPLGLSFYALQALTYTLDVYRRDAKPAGSYFAYLASVSFFPTTLAGPITRVATLLPLWGKVGVVTNEDGGRALFLIGLGLTKKFLIADYLATNLVNRVFDLPTLYSGGDVLVAVYAYAFQLYYDFSGYTDIAMGSALLLGIRLPINFNTPYRAENIADFWRRWHISFSNWLRDYLYFSLPGLRSPGKIFAYLILIITMVIAGVWHGVSWTFLTWGLLHGLGLAGFRAWQAIGGGRNVARAVWLRVAGAVLTFHFVLLAWVFFRSDSMKTALQILAQIGSLQYSFENTTAPFLLVLGIGVVAHFIPKAWFDAGQGWFARSPAVLQAGAIALLVVAIQYVATSSAAPFIYQKF
ncbi:MAG: MBOAT family O-acyltransferase [Bryobacteraceae bacterium]